MQRKNLFIAISLFLFLIIAIGVILVNFNDKKEEKACFQNHCFNVELAVSPEEKNNGLRVWGLNLYNRKEIHIKGRKVHNVSIPKEKWKFRMFFIPNTKRIDTRKVIMVNLK